ncbi:hypothetical protein Vadar_023230 [Vaccinium darrowii]|uniref:Uncharacterized protein n=1 Tax=Vaccinium darrowii TaxID=229202 RepID=A0ACB7ZDS9_9ERIC|nr:hypothetical protein Vadar_023230 [Vaccinium darrowii]
MAINAGRRFSERTQQSAFDRIRGGAVNVVCSFWLAGRCTRNPCRFLHPESPPLQPPKQSPYHHSKTWRSSPEDGQESSYISPSEIAAKNMSYISPSEVAPKKMPSISSSDCDHKTPPKTQEKKVIIRVLMGSPFLVAAPSFTQAGKDKTIRVWDCNTGQCVDVVNLSGEVGSLISEGPWVFVGLPNSVKAWNTQTQTELTLDGPVGQVYALAVGNDVLFAGTQDGTILAWKPCSQTNSLDLAASLKGHSSGVISLCVGAKWLYSGSMDNTIRVWDLNTFGCLQTLHGHTHAVMSVLCWESFLLSCSLDGTIKAWGATESGNIEVIHTHKEKHGFLELCGIQDAEGKPILLCSCNDDTVRLYDLPSFTERGRIFSKQEVRAIQIGSGGLFFTGDATGQLTVWKLAGEPNSGAP